MKTSRNIKLTGLALLASVALAAGCGGSSSSTPKGQPSKVEATLLVPAQKNASAHCTTQGLASVENMTTGYFGGKWNKEQKKAAADIGSAPTPLYHCFIVGKNGDKFNVIFVADSQWGLYPVRVII